MKISIITVVRNGEKHIKSAIDSVLSQLYQNIEYIVIDGKSSDNTMEIIKSYGNQITKFISEPDKGIYDAMNKGIKLATGDVIGILNSDDFYIDNNVLDKIAQKFNDKQIDSIYADLVYVKPNNLDKIVRYYDSEQFKPSKFAYGWMPAHPTFFVKRVIYDKYGLFKTDYKIASDYELLVRFLHTHKISYYYLNEAIIKMRIGGISTRGIISNYIVNKEIIKACKDNNINTNWFKVLSKYPSKILGVFKKQ